MRHTWHIIHAFLEQAGISAYHGEFEQFDQNGGPHASVRTIL